MQDIEDWFYACVMCGETLHRDNLAMDDAGDYFCADCDHYID